MGRIEIPYYVVIKGRGYWRPTKRMRAEGFSIIRCGPDGPAAWAIAEGWAERWRRHRTGEALQAPVDLDARQTPEMAESAVIYPRGSLGEAFARYRRTDEWARKAPRTREDWWRGWKRIKPIFGDVAPATVTLEDVSAWRRTLVAVAGVREAHRAMKIWRALWKVAAALRYCARDADPSLGVRNTAAAGRSATWTEGEVVRLVKGAWRAGYRGLAAAVAVMWDTQLSPVDVRTLTPGQLARTAVGAAFFTERAKTGAPVGAVLSRRTVRLLEAYLAGLGYTLHTDAPIFRSRGLPTPGPKGGRPHPGRPFTKDILSEEFRAVRTELFGAGERRQLLDLRRSGAVEAIAGGTNAEKLSHAMGNTLSSSNALYRTYVPANLTTVKDVAEARRRGRQKLRDENR